MNEEWWRRSTGDSTRGCTGIDLQATMEKSNSGGGVAPPSPKRSSGGTPPRSVEGTVAAAAVAVSSSEAAAAAVEDSTQEMQPQQQDSNEKDRDASSISSGKNKANDKLPVLAKAGLSIAEDGKSVDGLGETSTVNKNVSTTSTPSASTTVGCETAKSRGPSDMQGRVNAAVTTNRADQSNLTSSTTGKQQQQRSQHDTTPTLGTTTSTRKEVESSSASAAGVAVTTKSAAIPAVTEYTKAAAAATCATITSTSKAQQQRQNSGLVGNRPSHRVRPLPDPETVRLTNNILHLLQMYGPLTAELLEYNLPPLATSSESSKGGRAKVVGGDSAYMRDRLRQVLDLLVVLGVIGIAANPNENERMPSSSSGISETKSPAKVKTESAITKAEGEDQSRSAVAAAVKVDAYGDGTNVPAVGSNSRLPPASAQSPSSTNSDRTKLLREMSPGTSQQRGKSETIGKEAAVFVNDPRRDTSSNLPTGPQVQGSHRVSLPQCHERHQKEVMREKAVASPLRYVYLDGRPRADVIFPCQLPALIESAEQEVQGAIKRAKRLREELSVTPPNSKRSKTALKSVEEILRSLLKEFPEIVRDPVYLAALRSSGIDTSAALSELGQRKARLAGKMLKDEEGAKVEEIEELALAAGATPLSLL